MIVLDPAAEQVAARLRLSIAQKKRLILAARRNEASEPRALAYRIGHEAALDRLLLAGVETAALKGWHAPFFPLKGGAIVARGVAAGPEVAHILRAVEAQWIAEGFPDEDRVAQLLDTALVGEPAGYACLSSSSLSRRLHRQKKYAGISPRNAAPYNT